MRQAHLYLTRFYLKETLDSWAAYDEHVSHYAVRLVLVKGHMQTSLTLSSKGPVMQATPGVSERSVIICDIEPMVAQVCPI